MTAGAVLAEASALRAQIPTTTTSSLAAPAFAGVSGDGVTVTLSWYAVKGAIGYQILRTQDPQQKPVSVAALPNTTLGYHDKQAGAGLAYYQLVAIDSAGGRVASAWFEYAPPSIQSVSADGADIVVTWTGVQNAPGGYEVWRAASPNQRPTRIAAVLSSTWQHRDKQAAGGASYYQIVAVGSGGSRASSAWTQAGAAGITKNPSPTQGNTVAQQQIAAKVAAWKKAEQEAENVLAAVFGQVAAMVLAVVVEVLEFAGGTVTDADQQELNIGIIQAVMGGAGLSIAASVAAVELAVVTIIENLPPMLVLSGILSFQTQNVAAGDPQPNLLTRAQISQVAARIPPGDANTAGLTNALKKLVATLKPKA